MSHLIRSAALLTAAAGLSLATAVPASAAPAQHFTFEESFFGSEALTAEENPCGSWAGTFNEARTGSYKILVPPAGRVDGEYHINGAVDGLVELTPDDPNLPSYSGSYREKANGVITGFDEEQGDDTVRVARYALRAVLTGTDGSRLVLSLNGKITINARGDVVVDREVETCS